MVVTQNPRNTSHLLTPWFVAAIATIFAVVGWMGDRCTSKQISLCDPADTPTEKETACLGRSTTAVALRADARLGLLRTCREKLKDANILLRRCQAASYPASSTREGTRAEACLDDPAMWELVKRRVNAELEQQAELNRARRAETKITRERVVMDWMEGNLGLDAQQIRWLSEYVCAVRDMRAVAIPSTTSKRADSRYTWEQLRDERQTILSDLQGFLGKETYARLRAVGGLGILSDALQCD